MMAPNMLRRFLQLIQSVERQHTVPNHGIVLTQNALMTMFFQQRLLLSPRPTCARFFATARTVFNEWIFAPGL